MKSIIIKYLGVISLLAFSFFYTDKISKIIISKSPIMKDINNQKEKYESKSVDATINGSYIIPGISGKKVDTLESYYQMKSHKKFDKTLLVFEEITPSISINNHKTYIINKANSYKRAVSIIIHDNKEVLSYCQKNNINANRLSTMKTHENTSLELINFDDDYITYEKLLENINKQNSICYINSNNKSWCLEKEKYLVESTYSVNNSSIINLNITSGDIIYIDNTLSLNSFKLLLQKIKYQDLKIIFLSKLISE